MNLFVQDVMYTGETHVIKTRINKYLHTDKGRMVFQHLAGNDFSKSGWNESCFEVSNLHRFQIHLKWKKLTFNGKKQVTLLTSL